MANFIQLWPLKEASQTYIQSIPDLVHIVFRAVGQVDFDLGLKQEIQSLKTQIFHNFPTTLRMRHIIG